MERREGFKPAPRPKVEIEEGKDNQHYWHVQGANNEIQAVGEGYTSKQHAERGFEQAKGAFLKVATLRELLDEVNARMEGIEDLRPGGLVE